MYIFIGNEQELSDFVKEHYGKVCTYHEVATTFFDTFDIVFEGDGKSLDLSDCAVNYDYYLKYSPTNKKVASWNTSQECQIGLGFDKCFDKQISESFRFTKPIYKIDWDVTSNQPAPKNLDGIWRPDYSFTAEDIWNILRSIK